MTSPQPSSTLTVEGQEKEVDLSDLAKHIILRGLEISKQEYVSVQRPYNKIVGNFPFGIKVKDILSDFEKTRPKTPSHVVIKTVKISEQAETGYKGKRKLLPGKHVRVVKFFGEWAKIVSKGKKLGYVPAKVIAKIIK